MIKRIKNVDINYIQYGNTDGKELVFLHGWGQNIEMMKPLADPLSKQHHITIIDLPGHGSSKAPAYAWQVIDFVEALKELLNYLKINKPNLIGHSFGGKISLLYASIYDVDKLVLLASPFKKEIQKESIKLKVLKTLKKVPVIKNFEEFAKKHIGSSDYKNANPIMRQIIVNTVNCDITEDVKKIKASTLIIWGTLDEAVKIERAYELEKLIKDSGVIIYEGATHYAYLEKLGQTVNVLKTFFN